MAPADRPADELVTVGAVATELEAQLLVAALADEGIDAVSFPIGASLLPMATPARPHANLIPIQVHAREARRAAEIITERRRAADGHSDDGDSIEWDEVDVGDRTDHLPLGEPGRIPLSVRLIALGAIVLLAASCLVGAALTLSRGGTGSETGSGAAGTSAPTSTTP